MNGSPASHGMRSRRRQAMESLDESQWLKSCAVSRQNPQLPDAHERPARAKLHDNMKVSQRLTLHAFRIGKLMDCAGRNAGGQHGTSSSQVEQKRQTSSDHS